MSLMTLRALASRDNDSVLWVARRLQRGDQRHSWRSAMSGSIWVALRAGR